MRRLGLATPVNRLSSKLTYELHIFSPRLQAVKTFGPIFHLYFFLKMNENIEIAQNLPGTLLSHLLYR